MGKVIPTASFRRAVRPDPKSIDAFIGLDDAPGDTPPPEPVAVIEALTPVNEPVTAAVASSATSPASETMPVAPKIAVPAAAHAKWRRKTLQRADGRELRKQTVYLDAELSHRLKVVCADRQYDLSEAVEEAVTLWLKSITT